MTERNSSVFTYGPVPPEKAENVKLKETEIGMMPKEWEILELRELADITYGVQAAVAHLKDKSIGFPILTNVNMSIEGYIDISTLRYYDLPKNKQEKLLLKKGDVLFNWRSGSQHHVGKTALFNLDGNYTFSSFILRFRVNEKIRNDFLYYYLHFLKSQNYFLNKRDQSSVNSVFNASLSAKIPIYLPPFPEQKAIAHVLHVIQEAKEKTKEVIRATKELKKSTMRHLFTYGPVSSEEAERVKLKETEIGVMPEEWKIVELKGIGEIITGTTPSTKNEKNYGNKYPFISPADLGSTKYVYSAGKYLSDHGLRVSRPLPKDAVLVTCIGSTIGKTGMTFHDMNTTNQQINSIVCKGDVNPHFIYYIISFKSTVIKSLASTVAVPILNKSNFEIIRVQLPPLSIQQEIAEILFSIDAKIEAEENKKNALEGLFKTLLHDLMTAKIRVNNLPFEA